MAIANSDDIKDLVLKMIQEMDLDILDFRVEELEHDRMEVFTKHEVDGYEVELSLSEESSGTKKLFGLLPFIAESLIGGTTLVIDELDAKIPSCIRWLNLRTAKEKLFGKMQSLISSIWKESMALIHTSEEL